MKLSQTWQSFETFCRTKNAPSECKEIVHIPRCKAEMKDSMESPSDEVEIKKIQSNICFHSFTTNISERLIRFELMKFKDSVYLWIGDGRNRNFSDLSLALMSKYSREPTSTKIMGEETNLTSINMANKLSKKLKKPVYVSYNLPEDRLTVPAVNERLSEELKINGQYF